MTPPRNERTLAYHRALATPDAARLTVEVIGVLFTAALLVLTLWPRPTELLPMTGRRLRLADPERFDTISLHIYNLTPVPTNANQLDLSPTNLAVIVTHEPVVTASNRTWLITFRP